MSFQTSIPHRPMQVRCTLQWSLTEWLSACLNKWLPRRHQRGNWRKPQMKDVSNLIDSCPTISIQVKPWIFFEILFVSFKWYFWHKWKKLKLVLGPRSKDRKYSRDKANLCNPEVNKGCPPLTANCTSKDCLEMHQDLQCNILHWWSIIVGVSMLSYSNSVNCNKYWWFTIKQHVGFTYFTMKHQVSSSVVFPITSVQPLQQSEPPLHCSPPLPVCQAAVSIPGPLWSSNVTVSSRTSHFPLPEGHSLWSHVCLTLPAVGTAINQPPNVGLSYTLT